MENKQEQWEANPTEQKPKSGARTSPATILKLSPSLDTGWQYNQCPHHYSPPTWDQADPTVATVTRMSYLWFYFSELFTLESTFLGLRDQA